MDPAPSSPKARLGFLVVAATVIAFSTAVYLLRPTGDVVTAAEVTAPDFVAGLRDKGRGEACIALAVRGDVDLLIVGSSHAYAGIDPFILAQAGPGQSAALCAVAGWNALSFAALIEFLETERITPRRLVWLADGAAMRQLPNGERFVEMIERFLLDASHQRSVQENWRDAIDEGHAVFRLDEAGREDRLERQRDGLARINPEAVEALATGPGRASLDVLKTAMERSEPLPGARQALRRLCSQAVQRNIRLDVVLSPVPDGTVQAMSGLLASPEELADALGESLPCARRVIHRPLEQWGLDARHFVNRSADPDYSYEIWNDPDAFITHYESLSPRARLDVYDSNHLNAAGAEIFTRAVLQAID
ncbi:MAG: hypothetical protein AAFX09_00900 [Pseudomonadota bacterium]